ncbi:MAG: Aromatic amino acid transport protein [Candidatus Tokpelaia hoelldobleri]|uniref:Aromatic amino acid transport protein n=1 Tax=Candidatus Tokpelaia hoelldobleri TaxID=1902579 RepID=A0A1U9JV27_9HYPH|nr:MAG: Aromatic amino acid transport protein [Candidatus Tokpelaia hoelldoblerii]
MEEKSGGKVQKLARSLSNRHIQMIALGGAVGTGLFLGSYEAIQLAGPATIISYIIGGGIIYFIIRMLGEMSTQEPVSGAFSYFSYKYWGDFAGFFAGWNYWFLYILVSMAELTTAGMFFQQWFGMEPWKTSLAVLLGVTAINLVTVRFFGEFEFWFALIKILAVIGMIVLGVWLIATGGGGAQVSLSNLWSYGGFAPMGLTGIALALVVIMFSFGGTELIGITAGEAKDPRKSLPRAVNQIMWRILFFYIGAITVIMILNPWNQLVKNDSPFVTIFQNTGIGSAAILFQIVVFTATISVYNSGMYSNGRMLYGLAEQGNAPRLFMRLNRSHIPYTGVLFSSLCTLTIVIINYLVPDGAFMRIMAVATAAAAMTWAMIVLVHLRFRRAYRGREDKLYFKAPFYPVANYLCLAFLAFLLAMMVLTGFTEQGSLTALSRSAGFDMPVLPFRVQDMSLSVLVIPVWILLLLVLKTIFKSK